jgi:hypothetical protein
MTISTSHILTRQFYEWEQRGRGWHKADFLVDLEPPFVPFFGHFLEDGEIIDDARLPHWTEAIAALFNPAKATLVPVKEDDVIEAYPFSNDAPLTIYRITIPKQFRQSVERMEQLLIMLSYLKSPISFEIIASADTITLQCVCRETDGAYVQTQFQTFFADCPIREVAGDMLLEVLQTQLPLYTVDFGLREEFIRPLASAHSLEHDPYTALFGTLSRLGENEYVIVQVMFSGTHNAWAESILTAATDDSGKQSFFFDAPDMPILAKEKVSRPLFGVSVRAVALADTLEDAGRLLQRVVTTLMHASENSHNALIPLSDEGYIAIERITDIVLRVSHRVGMLFNSRELMTFVHIPSPGIHSGKLIHNTHTTKAAPDTALGYPYAIGLNEYQGVTMMASLSVLQRLRHIHIIGATGTGKSTLLHGLIMQDIEAGNGCMCLDPHGDLITALLSCIPEERIEDVVLIDPSDSDYPISFNILSAHSDVEKELLASDLVALFRRFSTSWGDQMNSVLANAIMAMVYNTTAFHIGELRRFLIEPSYREQVLTTVTDSDIAYYWHKEFPLLKSTSIGPILTRLDTFLRPRVIRNMVCQRSGLDLAQLMDKKKIVLVKLSQGLVGEENSYLLGAFMVSKLQQIAMARQAIAQEARVPFFCYIDEFQHFVTPSMSSILSGARKYGLGLILAHQDMQQVSRHDSDIAGSVLANAGTRICFRLGDTDAKMMAQGFSGFTAEDLQNLRTGEAIIRVNTADADFNIAVMPYDSDFAEDHSEAIIAHARKVYGISMPFAMPQPEAQKEPLNVVPMEGVQERLQPMKSQTVSNAESKTAVEIREHRYMQTFIKKMAEEYGYRASLEVPTPDGNGYIDVVIEKESERIAIEISVTTEAAWELHNIQKCLAAGYSRVTLCSKDAAKRRHVEQLLQTAMPVTEQEKVQVIGPDDLQALFLSAEKPSAPTHTVMKGYRVKVQYDKDGSDKTNLVKSILVAAKRP